jgi:hypothetical protein
MDYLGKVLELMVILFPLVLALNLCYLNITDNRNIFVIFFTNRYGTLPSSDGCPLPPLIVLATISTEMSLFHLMSAELESPKLELDLQDSEEEERVIENMEQEIECPRCYDIMTLSSDFDKLGYFCQECDLLLVMK